VGFVIFLVLVGGGLAWGFWFLGSLAHALPVLQWTLWVIAILVTLFTTLFVTVGGLTDLYKDEEKDKANKAKREAANEVTEEAKSAIRDDTA
jgi:4-hydroxybenzoate polyprenyltransferase